MTNLHETKSKIGALSADIDTYVQDKYTSHFTHMWVPQVGNRPIPGPTRMQPPLCNKGVQVVWVKWELKNKNESGTKIQETPERLKLRNVGSYVSMFIRIVGSRVKSSLLLVLQGEDYNCMY